MSAHTSHTMHTGEYDEDYEEERDTEYRAIQDEEDRLLHHSSWKRNAPSIERTIPTSIDTHPHQTTENEHRPIFPTPHRSTQESTVYEKDITRLAVGQMITITKAMQ
ncbi:hypothetical protein DY000_02039608 [Brassica cretica]|uniref:Uncharacterized protein n=1 Tax=Brassica cretica TaxID=69181 RepID=A0ABQ7BCC7_BRACR|nr:hypothetical protein DY000_02039608 [Brassica cretica]